MQSAPQPVQEVKEKKKVVHEDNEWGISLVATNEEIVEVTNTPTGTELAYTVDKPAKVHKQTT